MPVKNQLWLFRPEITPLKTLCCGVIGRATRIMTFSPEASVPSTLTQDLVVQVHNLHPAPAQLLHSIPTAMSTAAGLL